MMEEWEVWEETKIETIRRQITEKKEHFMKNLQIEYKAEIVKLLESTLTQEELDFLKDYAESGFMKDHPEGFLDFGDYNDILLDYIPIHINRLLKLLEDEKFEGSYKNDVAKSIVKKLKTTHMLKK